MINSLQKTHQILTTLIAPLKSRAILFEDALITIQEKVAPPLYLAIFGEEIVMAAQSNVAAHNRDQWRLIPEMEQRVIEFLSEENPQDKNISNILTQEEENATESA